MWTVDLHPLKWSPNGLISRLGSDEPEWEQEIETKVDSHSDVAGALLWSARVFSDEEIKGRFQIDWKAPPIGSGRFGKVDQVSIPPSFRPPN